MKHKKTILVAPLHWGLGHATRCIPIINALLKNGYQVLLASDGAALQLLQKEFPKLPSVALPSYEITYPKTGFWLRWKLLRQIPRVRRAIRAEKKVIAQLVADGKIHGIVSDNRFGVRHNDVPSVFVTHQLRVLSGNTTIVSSRLHQNIISKFDVCWVPDVDGPINLSGKLGHITNHTLPVRYIGPLSRMTHRELPTTYDVLCLLSGPEPQRSLLEKRLRKVFESSQKNIALVQGIVSEQKTVETAGNITTYNYLNTTSLEEVINKSSMVVSRSGYTTIMDIAVMGKPAFFIPTPGQYEQKYLAKRLKQLGMVPSCKQETFTEKKLEKVALYKGLAGFESGTDLSHLFGLFEGK